MDSIERGIYLGRPFDHVVLGAWDPERGVGEELCEQAGKPYSIAQFGGQDVTHTKAYRADLTPDIQGLLDDGATLAFFECAVRGIDRSEHVVFDHHRRGDPGHDIPADGYGYQEGASGGQLARALGIELSTQQNTTIANDHDYRKAREDLCTGVPRELSRKKKVDDIAESQNTTVATVEATVEDFMKEASRAPRIIIGSAEVVDLTRRRMGFGYSLSLLCAQVALIEDREAALICNQDAPDERFRVALTGRTDEELVQSFAGWAKRLHLVDPYGSDIRGYGGAYVPLADTQAEAVEYLHEVDQI